MSELCYFSNPTEITAEHYILDKVSAVMLSLLVASKFSIRDFKHFYSSNVIMNATYFWISKNGKLMSSEVTSLTKGFLYGIVLFFYCHVSCFTCI